MVTAVLTLAVGLGISVAVFAVVNVVLLRDLPFPESERMMTLWVQDERGRLRRVSGPEFEDWRAGAESFSGLAALYEGQSANIGGNDRATERVSNVYVSAGLLELFDVVPTVGRSFTEEDDRPGAEATAIIGNRLWQTCYEGDPAALGSPVRINGEVATIVGVMPPDVIFPRAADIWIPHSLLPANRRAARLFEVYGLLAEGVSIEQARAELASLGQRLALVDLSTNPRIGPAVVPLSQRSREGLWLPMLLIQGAVVVVFLIACANVANLLLKRFS